MCSNFFVIRTPSLPATGRRPRHRPATRHPPRAARHAPRATPGPTRTAGHRPAARPRPARRRRGVVISEPPAAGRCVRQPRRGPSPSRRWPSGDCCLRRPPTRRRSHRRRRPLRARAAGRAPSRRSPRGCGRRRRAWRRRAAGGS